MILRYRFFRVFSNHGRKLSHYTPAGYSQLISTAEVKKFCIQCLEKVGAQSKHAKALSDVLVAGDYRGHYSHGLNRLEMYVQDIQKGVCSTDLEPIIVKETVSTALVDGKNVLGPVVGNFAMETAIKKADKTGIAFVAAFGSNHFGIAGWYSLMALQQGLIGLAFTNTSPLVFPTRARKVNCKHMYIYNHALNDVFILWIKISTIIQTFVLSVPLLYFIILTQCSRI
ncbi:unnamed protein product [Schistosoma curassoni]|uniref:Malate dehydrogenase n=1 Tax=Schistosoma curassoni TaxID=6186 RepID=A0A183JSC9_9TREM|nr:unnamed protein product [Schistosoma curassoni]